MFERLPDAPYWKRLVLAAAVRWRKPSKPLGSLFGWDVWAMDGMAYLFKGSQCRRADWFEFCHAVRVWIA